MKKGDFSTFCSQNKYKILFAYKSCFNQVSKNIAIPPPLSFIKANPTTNQVLVHSESFDNICIYFIKHKNMLIYFNKAHNNNLTFFNFLLCVLFSVIMKEKTALFCFSVLACCVLEAAGYWVIIGYWQVLYLVSLIHNISLNI